MIFIDRNRVPEPNVLKSQGQSEIEQAHEFYSLPTAERRRKRFSFKVYRHNSVRQALMQLFHGKCAYCESKIGKTQPPDIEQFRPKGGVITANGKHLPDHYYWLANEWNNLYITCIDCNRVRVHEIDGVRMPRGKGNRFPLENEGKRAKLRAAPSEISNEKPLLLDPCFDDPDEHLVFMDSGLVVSDTRRGRTTIDLLALNRPYLVEARFQAAQMLSFRLQELASQVRKDGPKNLVSRNKKWLENCVLEESEFAALHRQLIRDSKIRNLLEVDDSIRTSTPRPKSETERIRKDHEQYLQEQDAYSLGSRGDRKKYFSRSRLIERIEIHNLKSIADLKLSLRKPGAGTPWTMFLGENGTGKSTILHAIALTLCGAEYFSKLVNEIGIDTDGFIRSGCSSGYVKVFLGRKPNVLKFEKGRVTFTNTKGKEVVVRTRNKVSPSQAAKKAWGIQLLQLAYGATRLLPRKPEMARARKKHSAFAKLDNLFDPFVPLLDARTWLLDLPPDRFDYTARALKLLLNLDDTDDLLRENGEVFIRSRRTKVPLDRLSDGYQSVIALTTDILEVVLSLWETPEMAEGIVLVDEIGAHMHPRWKMRIVSALREFFPQIQFIATTHHPLCLRGLSNHEIVVMRRDANRKSVPITELPSTEGLRVDQLLTSEFFGLESTIDPEIQEKFDAYYSLRRKQRLNLEQKERLIEIRRFLDRHGMLGKTRRERLMLDAIDKHLAKEKQDLTADARKLGEDQLDLQLNSILEDLKAT